MAYAVDLHMYSDISKVMYGLKNVLVMETN